MMSIEEFHHEFRQEILLEAEVGSDFRLSAFLELFTSDLKGGGSIEDFTLCHYRATKGMRVDGYWYQEDEEVLDLFVADFSDTDDLGSIGSTDVSDAFRRLRSFLDRCLDEAFFVKLEETSPECGLARFIHEHGRQAQRINLFLLSDRRLNSRLKAIPNQTIGDTLVVHHVWDMSRLHAQHLAAGRKEAIEIDLASRGGAIPCLRAHLGEAAFQSYLLAMPGATLAGLYGEYGARLLEQNVRCFLQVKGNVNKGIRRTIFNEPDRFFSYNNGITATALDVRISDKGGRIQLEGITGLQIVNGGQTTASLYHATRGKEKANLDNIFVQMKLSVIAPKDAEKAVPLISEYANTQNRVNAADFFSNHPYHIRMEEFSRRIGAPPQAGEVRETKWFYERSRGQYRDGSAKGTEADIRRFKATFPKNQMFDKTDLAKFENVWDDHPAWANRGSQKSFARFAERIGRQWEQNESQFNELYFKRVVARGIMWRFLERDIPKQSWYENGYRHNIICYTLAVINEFCRTQGKVVDFSRIWDRQAPTEGMEQALRIISCKVAQILTDPPEGVRNISEWAKKDGCWGYFQGLVTQVGGTLPDAFISRLIPVATEKTRNADARQSQRELSKIRGELWVFEKGAGYWRQLEEWARGHRILSTKESDILNIACCIPARILSERQCRVLIAAHDRAIQEGFYPKE